MKQTASIFGALILVVSAFGLLTVPRATDAQSGDEDGFTLWVDGSDSPIAPCVTCDSTAGAGVIVQLTNIPCGKTVRNNAAICSGGFLCSDGAQTTAFQYKGVAHYVCENGADVDNLVRVSGFLGQDHVLEYGQGSDVLSVSW